MLVNNGKDVSVRSGNIMFEESVEMTVDVNSINMSFLLTNLYQDPELAVIREYIANGMDAHTAAGVDTPVMVYAPTYEVPEFRVTDFGVGMSRETMTTVYPMYGASLKSDSNDEIGGFGLGCKVGLAVSSQFTVNTTKDGWNTLAIVQRTDAGKPSLNIISHTKTDDPNGTTVSIPMKPSTNFTDKLMRFLFFADQSKVQMAEGYSVPGHYTSIVHEGGNFASDSTSASVKFLNTGNGRIARTGSVYVIMGGIFYEVDANLIISNLTDENKQFAGIFSYFSTVIDANVGDLSLTPNRESLRFDEKTVNFFNGIIEDVFTNVGTRDEEAIKDCKNFSEAYSYYNNSMSRILGKVFKWKGFPLSNGITMLVKNPIATASYYTGSNRMSYSDSIGDKKYLAHSSSGGNFSNTTIVINSDPDKYKYNAKPFVASLYDGSTMSDASFVGESDGTVVFISGKDYYPFIRHSEDFKDVYNVSVKFDEVEDFTGCNFLTVVDQPEFVKVAAEYRASQKDAPKRAYNRKKEDQYTYTYYERTDSGYSSRYVNGGKLQDILEDDPSRKVYLIPGDYGNGGHEGLSILSNFLAKETAELLFEVFDGDIIRDSSQRMPETLSKVFKYSNIEIIEARPFIAKVMEHLSKNLTKKDVDDFSIYLSAYSSSRLTRESFNTVMGSSVRFKDPVLKTIQTSYKSLESRNRFKYFHTVWWDYMTERSLCDEVDYSRFSMSEYDFHHLLRTVNTCMSLVDDNPDLTIKVNNLIHESKSTKED